MGSFVVPKARTNYADDYDFWISKGRGQGKFRSYNPWLTIRDVKSPVGCSRIWSQKFKRTIHTLSYGETLAFFILERQDDVVDVREQYPLDPANTRDICHEMGLQHPGVGGRDIVMTTDFLVTYQLPDGKLFYKAYNIKPSEKYLTTYALKNIAIEERYWQLKNIELEVILADSLNKILADNIKQVIRYYDPLKIQNKVDYVKYLIAHKILKVDMETNYLNFPKLARQYLPDDQINHYLELPSN